jgi:hypothetical protein
MFSRLARAGNPNLGNVEILGDPATRTDVAAEMVKYIDQGYNVAEEVNLGLGGRFPVPAASSPTVGTTLNLPAPNTSLPFKTLRATIPSNVALYFMLTRIKIAATDFLEGDPICGDIFSEVSLNNSVRWSTAQTGQQIQMDVSNTDPGAAHEPRLTLTGIRLRN